MIRYFAGHRTAANLLMIALLAIGILTVSGMQRETMPRFAASEVEVRVVYPGASPEDVEEAICARIEDAVDGIEGVDEVRSQALESVGVVVVRMVDGARSMDSFLAEIKREVDAISDLPDLTEEPVVRELGWQDLVVTIAVSGHDLAEPDLKAYCEDLKDRLRRETGVRLVNIAGFSDHQLRIELSAEVLQRYGLSARDVADIVASQSVDVPAGTILTDGRDVLVRFTDERRTPLELAGLVIVSNARGGQVTLGEMATIRDQFEQDEVKIELDGERAAMLNVMKTRSEDALNIYADVEGFVERELQRNPPGIRLTLTQDVASIVSDRLSMLTRNGWQGILLVFGVLTLFFALRFAFWVAMGIPVAFFGSFFLLQQLGISLNMISMVGLLLALGLLMDDAIVLAENVAAHRQRGASPLRAAVDGVREVSVGVLSSFATTVFVFAPLLFVEGDMGKVLVAMPAVLIVVLAVSLVEAFLILPNHLNHALHHFDPERQNAFRRGFNRGLGWVRERALGGTVDWAVSHRWLVTGLVALLFLGSVAQVAGGRVQFVAFPDVEGDVVEARLLQPQGTPLRRTEEVVEHLTESLRRVDRELMADRPEVTMLRSVLAAFGENPEAAESGAHVARIVVDLEPAAVRPVSVDEFLARWRSAVGEVPGVLALQFTEPTYGPAGRPIDVRLQGRDLDELKRASTELVDWLGAFDGVVDLSDDLRPGKPEFRLSLAEGAAGLGLSASGIANQLRAAFLGTTAREIQVGVETYEVDVRLAQADKSLLSDLERQYVTLQGGRQVPLTAVAEIHEARGWARIARVNGRRTVTVRGDVDISRINASKLMGELKKSFLPEFQERHPNVVLDLEGQAKESAKTGKSLGRAMAVGLLAVFLLLSFQFKSYSEPLIVMTAIPLCLIGVIWGHILMGLPLTMPSVFGFVSLTGVVVNDSILLVEFVKRGRRAGLSVVEAAKRASRERFRAVLLTSLTTVFGLVPLLSETSLQAQFLIPLAASIVFGILSSTALVLVVLPVFYGVLNDLGLASPDEEEEEYEAAPA